MSFSATTARQGRCNSPQSYSIVILIIAAWVLFRRYAIISDSVAQHEMIQGQGAVTNYKEALDESFGFFTDIPDNTWAMKKQIVRTTNRNLNSTVHNYEKYSVGVDQVVHYYTNTWNPDFSCPMDRLVGPIGDGHKWVCDAHRLATVDNCLIYSVGSNGNFGFEKELYRIAPNCEIHIFDPDDYSGRMGKDFKAAFHAWGLKGSYAELKVTKKLKGRDLEFYTMEESMKKLGHTGRTVHVFKIDCEGCEWSTYADWLKEDIRQILVETHGWGNESFPFFTDIKNAGYVMTHKEANILAKGYCIEFAFLKLADTFFK